MDDSQLTLLQEEDARLESELHKMYSKQPPGALHTDPRIIMMTQRRGVIAKSFGDHLDEVVRPREEAIEREYTDAMIALQEVPVSQLDEACTQFAALTKKRMAIWSEVRKLAHDSGRGAVPPLNHAVLGNRLTPADAKDPSAIRRCVVGHGSGSPLHSGQRQTYGSEVRT